MEGLRNVPWHVSITTKPWVAVFVGLRVGISVDNADRGGDIIERAAMEELNPWMIHGGESRRNVQQLQMETRLTIMERNHICTHGRELFQGSQHLEIQIIVVSYPQKTATTQTVCVWRHMSVYQHMCACFIKHPFIFNSNKTSRYITIRCVTICHSIMTYYVIICQGTLPYVTVRYDTSWYAIVCYYISRYVIIHCDTPWYVTICHKDTKCMTRHSTSQYIMVCYDTLQYVTIRHDSITTVCYHSWQRWFSRTSSSSERKRHLALPADAGRIIDEWLLE